MPKVTKHPSNNLVTVSYPVREAVLDITKAEHDLIVSFSNEKVKMIKFIRSQYNLGLYDAKQVVDTVIASADDERNQRQQENTEVDWSNVPTGTRIHVRDCNTEDWRSRRFIVKSGTAPECSKFPFVCLSEDGEGRVNWKYAKLITD